MPAIRNLALILTLFLVGCSARAQDNVPVVPAPVGDLSGVSDAELCGLAEVWPLDDRIYHALVDRDLLCHPVLVLCAPLYEPTVPQSEDDVVACAAREYIRIYNSGYSSGQ